MIALGLDIGSNSVGSAWVDTKKQEIVAGVSVFPAGVDEADDKRGAPRNQDRRAKRSLRRNLARRSNRKRIARRILTNAGLLPATNIELQMLFQSDPWELRRRGLSAPLTAHEFGRVLIHLMQRRGAVGFDADLDSEGKVKQAMSRLHLTMMEQYGTTEHQKLAQELKQEIESLQKQMSRTAGKESTPEAEGAPEKKDLRRNYEDVCDELKILCRTVMDSQSVTFGRFVADLRDKRRHLLTNPDGSPKTSAQGGVSLYEDPIRNRADQFEFHADRSMIRDEFEQLWERQIQRDGALGSLTVDQQQALRISLDNPTRDSKWRHQGAIFGQRLTYWNINTLGRCDLEPTDRCAPIADRHASYYRVIETVNNLRIRFPENGFARCLLPDERDKVIARLQSQKTVSIATLKQVLGIDTKTLKKSEIPARFWPVLNFDGGDDREINTDWFHREIVIGAIGEAEWDQWPENKKEGLNKALLKCDPAILEDAERLHAIAVRMGLNSSVADQLVSAWKARPKMERRVNLSRTALVNLLPYLCTAFCGLDRKSGKIIRWKWLKESGFNPVKHRWPTQIEAREMFADDQQNSATDDQRKRYRLGAKTLTKADRHYMLKHKNELPPAPMLSNPVVRKAIHEVRRHVIAHMRAHKGKKPDRIVIEFAREAKKSKKQADWMLALNRKRERIRKQIIEKYIQPEFGSSFHTLSHNQLQAAIDRVILAIQQKGMCAYSGDQHGLITPLMAARGTGLEIDHIVPRALGGSNAWSNRVLCRREANRNKGRLTPRQWWGEEFDQKSRPMAFMENHEPAKGDPQEFFTRKDYAAKWQNFSREDQPQEWRGSQLTDTAYAARQVQSYLQSALWPTERSHLEGGKRRIFVTIGSYTHQLRKDWQLFQKLIKPSESPTDEVQQASLKNRGDHREHAVDAVAIAFTGIPVNETHLEEDGLIRTRIQDLAHHQQQQAKFAQEVKEGKRERKPDDRKPLPPPWGDIKSFRHQVMSQIFSEYEVSSSQSAKKASAVTSIVVSHRPVGRKILGKFHEDTLFGPVPGMENIYLGRKAVVGLSPAHLRLPEPEKKADSVKRLAEELVQNGNAKTIRDAKMVAKALVESPEFVAPLIDPSPGKSGLVRDLDLRRQIRACLAAFEYTEKDRDGKIRKQYLLNPDEFTDKELLQAVAAGAIRQASGVPIKRVKLLRTMSDPVIVHRKRWDSEQGKWVRDTGKDGELQPHERSRADRAYVGGNNHHIEIREDSKGRWSGTVVSMHEAAQRVRQKKQSAVNRSDDSEQGRFIMSLAAGETVFMKNEETGQADYFVVFKLDKSRTIYFMHHWDARRAKGEKDENGIVLPDSKRREIGVAASNLKNLAPEGSEFPFKVSISPLGQVQKLLED
ncbi:type II CRISPR RNA-guided endonuclease Cas9 [Planctomicrobium sp. SH527]|uniref:type II CRISPR RNA-guided endonuclease Cas9 n=1 Tax=Planctomicrobium sp. SH527 TaxID=3448123 RepID=UPI003F5B1E31